MTSMVSKEARAPDYIAPIVAYRAWTCFSNDRLVGLFPLSQSGLLGEILCFDWEGAWSDWVTASCHQKDHAAPDEACSCGFYALKSVEEAAEVAVSHPWSSLLVEGEDRVMGCVQLAGKVVEHASGYRAERARVAELIPTTSDGGITRSLASRLSLPVASEFDTTSLIEQLQPPPNIRRMIEAILAKVAESEGGAS